MARDKRSAKSKKSLSSGKEISHGKKKQIEKNKTEKRGFPSRHSPFLCHLRRPRKSISAKQKIAFSRTIFRLAQKSGDTYAGKQHKNRIKIHFEAFFSFQNNLFPVFLAPKNNKSLPFWQTLNILYKILSLITPLPHPPPSRRKPSVRLRAGGHPPRHANRYGAPCG